MKQQFTLKDLFAKNHHKLIDEESDTSLKNQLLSEIEIDQMLCSKQKQIEIDSTPIYFPHQPYDVQVEYMGGVIKALNTKQNALLESPTGTGKTLSLLCASLAWLKKNRKEENSKSIPLNLKIIYASRTHAQLKQVAQELKKTVYKPNISMLGSRDQYCVRGDFSQIKGNILNQSCRKSVKENTCQFYKKDFLINMANMYPNLISNLEEARHFGLKNRVCPYYFERQRLENADLILLPYNYLLEKDFQDVVNIENSILIFDEAHNVQATAEDGSSFFINHNTIIEAEKDLERWIEELESVNLLHETLKVKLNQQKLPTELKEYRAIGITIKVFNQYIEEMKRSPIFQTQETEEKFAIFKAREILDIIFQNTQDKDNTFRLWTDSVQTNYSKGINKTNIIKYLQHCLILSEVLGEHSATPAYHFEAWTKFIVNVHDLMLVEQEREKQNLSLNSLLNQFNQYKMSMILDSQNQMTIHMWCLEPSLAFSRLFKKNIYSVMLTSGTLSPMQSWTCELKMDFNIQVSNKHIVDIGRNLRVFQHKQFDFSYNQRNNEDQINRLGINLLNLCQVIPNGILVIFSSYSLMFKFKSKWSYSKLIQRINQEKQCFWEPQQTAEMQNTFESYRQKAAKGAIMFAVQRGKVAEGIDFSDELCRAIFLIGVPYPPKQDHRLAQKMDYLDQIYRDPEFNNQQRLRSSEWYTQQAIRATNQAIGRVIRHINDFGIVYLLDKRFEYSDIKKGLSEWVKPAIEGWINDDDITKRTKDFFNRSSKQQLDEISMLVEEKKSLEYIAQKKKPQIKFFGLSGSGQKELKKLQLETQKQQEFGKKLDFNKEPVEEQQKQKIIINSIHTNPPEVKKIHYEPQNERKQENQQMQNESEFKKEKVIFIDNDQNESAPKEQFDYFGNQADIFKANKDRVEQTQSKKKGLCIKLKNQK